MDKRLEKYKGIHPGLILGRELTKRNLKKGPFALSIQEYPQIMNEVTKGRRGLTPSFSMKLDEALGFEEGTFLILQAYYEIRKEKEKGILKNKPQLDLFRKVIFWDTDIDKIDWSKHGNAVIRRVFERGNQTEKKEVLRFYGQDRVSQVVGNAGIDHEIPVMSHLTKK